MRHHHHHHPSRLVNLGENLATLVETGTLAAMTLGAHGALALKEFIEQRRKE